MNQTSLYFGFGFTILIWIGNQCHYFFFFLYSQTIKECVHHATSLSERVLQIGTLGWPLEVSASHITQLQFATAMEDMVESTRHQVFSLLTTATLPL